MLQVGRIFLPRALVKLLASETTLSSRPASPTSDRLPLEYTLDKFVVIMSKGAVLITGVNGYIAAVAAKHFLDHGYPVRGTVRKQASAKDLIEGPLKEYAEAGNFTVVEVPDITVDGAFDQAVKGTSITQYIQLILTQEQESQPSLI